MEYRAEVPPGKPGPYPFQVRYRHPIDYFNKILTVTLNKELSSIWQDFHLQHVLIDHTANIILNMYQEITVIFFRSWALTSY